MLIGWERFAAAVVTDSTGNTKLFRELLVLNLPTIINFPDCVHFISNTIKDITRLLYFQPVILIVRGAIKKFHQSHIGTFELDKAKTELSIGRGLESIGKTRFGTTVIGARSVERNIPTIKKVAYRGLFDLGVSTILSSIYSLLNLYYRNTHSAFALTFLARPQTLSLRSRNLSKSVPRP